MASSSGCEPRAGGPSSPGAARRAARVCRSEASPPVQAFPRACRLTSRRQFLSVYSQGRRVGTRSLSMFGLPNEAGTCRLGITVTRKIGGAVRRNRIKRMLRDIFRRHRLQLAGELDLVINAHRDLDDRDMARLERDFLDAHRRLARRWAP